MATSIPAFLISYEFSHQFPVFSHVTFVGVFSLTLVLPLPLFLLCILNVIRVNKKN